MLLLVDAGNTRIKWALADMASNVAAGMPRWLASGAVFHADAAQLGAQWQGLQITRARVSNVAGAAVRAQIERALPQARTSVPVSIEWFASAASLAGVHNGYRNPAQLGCDRFASAIGAHVLYPSQALVVATCGTATTVDAISADGVFIGGMILPGLGLMATSLARNTAQLPQVGEPLGITQCFADNTDDAIISGCIAAQTGAIERAVAAHAHVHGQVRCVLSGGAAAMIAPHLSVPCDIIENLVLTGLYASAFGGRSC